MDKNLYMSENNPEKQVNIEEKINIEEDVEFDDNIDIDALQTQLQNHMSNVEYTPAKGTETTEDNAEISTDENSTSNDNLSDALELEEFIEAVEKKDEDNQNSDTSVNNTTEENTENSGVLVPQNTVDENLKPTDWNSKPQKLKLKQGEKKYVIYIEPDNIDFIESLTVKDRKKVINRLLREEDATLKKRKAVQERKKFINQIMIMVVTVVITLPIFFYLLNKSIEITILNYQQSQQNFIKLYKEQGKIKSYKNFRRTFD